MCSKLYSVDICNYKVHIPSTIPKCSNDRGFRLLFFVIVFIDSFSFQIIEFWSRVINREIRGVKKLG